MDRQPRSGLATVKRDFSSNIATATSSAFVSTARATKRSALSDSLRKAIQDGVASREAENTPPPPSSLTASPGRPLSPEAAPPAKKRRLPSSWGDCEPSESPLDPSSQLKPVRRPPTISLSDEQKAVLELVMQGKNIFYTGSAGMPGFP
jgi:hypothetical protein